MARFRVLSGHRKVVGTIHEKESSTRSFCGLLTPHRNLCVCTFVNLQKFHRRGNVTKQQLKVWTYELGFAVVFSALERYRSEIREGN